MARKRNALSDDACFAKFERTLRKLFHTLPHDEGCAPQRKRVLCMATAARRRMAAQTERARVERSILREGMLDELMTRHAQYSSVVERYFANTDNHAATQHAGHSQSQENNYALMFERAMSSANAIESAVDELRPGVPSSTPQKNVVSMLQQRSPHLVVQDSHGFGRANAFSADSTTNP